MASSLALLMTQAQALDDPLPCHRENPQLCFPADLQLAKEYCQPCAMRRVCLAGAVERQEPHGVWGGEVFARGAIITEETARPAQKSRTGEVVTADPSPRGQDRVRRPRALAAALSSTTRD